MGRVAFYAKEAAWARINRAAGTTSYSLILKERFADAVALVRREMAVLRNMRSAPRKDDSWRAKRIGAIKAESLSDLATDELQRTYAYIMAKRG